MNKIKVDLPSYGEVEKCHYCGEEYIEGYIGTIVENSEHIEICEKCTDHYEEINKNGKLYITHKDVIPKDCSFDVYEYEDFIILLDYDKEKTNDFNIQYNLLNDDFNKLFTRKYWKENDYCINEWTTSEFKTPKEMFNFLKGIGLNMLGEEYYENKDYENIIFKIPEKDIMKLKKVEIIEYYFVESKNNWLYRRPKNGSENDWEFLKDDKWIHFDDGDWVEEALLKYENKN